jgi:cytoskeletal protein CcmA (bactofilin family)
MFTNSSEETVIAESLKIEGTVTADGLVRVHGKIIGELRCSSLIISQSAEITGTVTADEVEVDGTVDGPIRAANVVLHSQAHVSGDIHHTSLSIEKGAVFEGRSKQSDMAAKKNKSLASKANGKKIPAPANDDARAELNGAVA